MAAFTIDIDTSDLRRWANKLKRAAAHIPFLTNRILEPMAHRQLEILQEETPVGKRTLDSEGHLRDSYSLSLGGLRYEIRTSQPQKVVWLTQGTTYHGKIVPRFKKALYWEGIKGGHPVPYAARQGLKPNDFVDRAVSRGEREGIDTRALDSFVDGILE